MKTWLAGRLFLAAVAVLLAAPVFVLAGVSLNEKKTLLFPPDGLSLSWYADIVIDSGWRSALIASVTVAALSAAVAVSIALPIAWFLWRRIFPLAELVRGLGMAPFILPPVITALGFLSFWASIGFYGQPWTVLISHGVFLVALPLVTLSMGFSAIDREIVEAGATMGADDRTLLRTIVIPLMTPYLVSGYAFAFVLSLNEDIIAYMTAGFTLETLPIKVFNALRYGSTPTMAAVAVVFVALAAVVFGLIARVGDLRRLLGALDHKG
ncbi:MAG TPA: ABC transporter permease subunit [Methylomirabilota bacterium]|nr:ABC transporter permease subunit [Methylomirabilota bacterium]